MIDPDHPAAVRSDDVLHALAGRGFECRIVDRHAIATRDATRLVVPAPGQQLPHTFVRRLEHALDSILGTGWLTCLDDGASPPRDTTSTELDDVILLDAVVDQCPTSNEWCAFLSDQLTVMGRGTTRLGALRDLKAATALWLGVAESQLAFITPDII